MADNKPPFRVRAKKVAELTAWYSATYATIEALIISSAKAGKINKIPLQTAINKELGKLDAKVADWTTAEMTQYYADGHNAALTGLRAADAKIVKSGITTLDKQAISNIVDTTQNALHEAIIGISRNASNIISDAVRQQLNATIAQGKLDNDLRKSIAASVEQQLNDNGITSLTDSAGRGWDFDSYAKMLVTTNARNARNDGVANQMLQNGYDLAQISDTDSDHPACADHEGEIISITGKSDGYESLEDVTDDGIFHPNCQHVYDVVDPPLAKQLKIYDNPTYDQDDSD